MEEVRLYPGEERHIDGEVTEEKNPDEGIDHLLILAHSAELMSASENDFHTAHQNDQTDDGSHATSIAQQSLDEVSDATTKDQKALGKQLDEMNINAHVNTEKDELHWQGRTIRLSQIRRQARSKNQLLVQKRIGEYTDGHLQGRTTRLSKIRWQARSKNQLLEQERSGGSAYGQLQGRTTRLSQLRRQARSKYNLLMQEGIGEHIHESLNCHTSEGNQRERVAADQCETKESCKVVTERNSSEVESMNERHIHEGVDQSAAAVAAKRWCEQIENGNEQLDVAGVLEQPNIGKLREQHCIARQLRALRTKKRRAQLRRQHLCTSPQQQMHALEKNQIGQTSLIDTHQMLHVSMMLRDQRFIACQQEPLRTTEWKNQIREEVLDVAQSRGHIMVNQPGGQIYETHQQWLQNTLNVHNEGVKCYFPVLPNNKTQGCEMEQQWPLLMSIVQQKKYYRMAARQKRAQRIEEKRASRNVHKNFNNHVLNEDTHVDGRSPCLHAVRIGELDKSLLKVDHDFQQVVHSSCHKEPENKVMCVKGRMRLSHLRHEARMRNSHLAARRHAGSSDRGEESVAV